MPTYRSMPPKPRHAPELPSYPHLLGWGALAALAARGGHVTEDGNGSTP